MSKETKLKNKCLELKQKWNVCFTRRKILTLEEGIKND